MKVRPGRRGSVLLCASVAAAATLIVAADRGRLRRGESSPLAEPMPARWYISAWPECGTESQSQGTRTTLVSGKRPYPPVDDAREILRTMIPLALSGAVKIKADCSNQPGWIPIPQALLFLDGHGSLAFFGCATRLLCPGPRARKNWERVTRARNSLRVGATFFGLLHVAPPGCSSLRLGRASGPGQIVCGRIVRALRSDGMVARARACCLYCRKGGA